MTALTKPDAFGRLTTPTTLEIQRLLPGPIERVFDYLTKSELRRQWLASGDMKLSVGAPFTLTWRNDELSPGGAQRPEGHDAEHSSTNTIIEVTPPTKLVITFGKSGQVSFDLKPVGDKVLLTLVHSRVPDRDTLLSVSSGWHAHLDIMAAKIAGSTAPPDFWSLWAALKDDYTTRFPA